MSKFRGPEFFGRNEIRWRAKNQQKKRAAHHIRINHHAATHRAAQRVHRSRPTACHWIEGTDAASADLAARKNIGAIDRLPVSVHDAIHVWKALILFKVAGRTALPNTVVSAQKRDDRLPRINSGAIIGNVAVRWFPKDDIYGSRIGGPYGKAQTGFGDSWCEVLVGSQATAVCKVVAFDLRCPVTSQTKLRIALNGIHILDFGRNAPEIVTLRAVDHHPPPEHLVLVGKVERDRGFEDRTPIFSDSLLHRRFRPIN